MPRAAKKVVTAKERINHSRTLSGLIALAAQGGIIKMVEREGSRLKVTYLNGIKETITFEMPWQAVLVVMTLKELKTCIEQAKVTKTTKELPGGKSNG